METEKVREKVYRNYEEGYHCAEAIVNTIRELHPSGKDYSCNVASGFCGGIGKCHEDVCGALAGGIIALGNIYGRSKGGEDIGKLVHLSVELRQQFIGKFRSTVCRDIKDLIGDTDILPGIASCRDVTAETAVLLDRLITEQGQ